MAKPNRQLALDLRPMPRWGGRRDGAGRKRGPNPRDPHRRRAPVAARFPCHVTLKVRPEVPSLRSVRLVRDLERSFAAACDRGRFRLVHYSIQANHAHLIVEAASARDLASGMKSIAARLARAANRAFARHGSVLADRYHLHVLRTPREVRRAIAYVLLNARRHLAQRGRPLPRHARIDPDLREVTHQIGPGHVDLASVQPSLQIDFQTQCEEAAHDVADRGVVAMVEDGADLQRVLGLAEGTLHPPQAL